MIRSIIVSVIMMMVSVPASSQNSANEQAVQDAIALIRSGDIQRGVLAMQGLAELGVPEALFHMGEINKLGIGKDEPSIPVATMFYRLASKLGHERASLLLANILFFDGDGSEATYAEALEVWQSLALKGRSEAIYMLGMVYWNGEAGAVRDPIRGYGLVWLAAEQGYNDAIQNELSMKSMLNTEARNRAMQYARNLDEEGFGADPIAMELVLESSPVQVSTPVPVEEKPLVKPDDWSTVWRLEVGFAMSQLEVERLQKVIASTQSQVIGALFSEVIDSANRPGLYRLVYGPVKSMHDAVSRCVDLKRAGHDCFARPPED
ncbi:MAG: tetratricopeptide repeat protein [Kordiimonas sp.]